MKKTYKAIHIDAEKREFKIIEIALDDSLKTLQTLVGGYITPGHYFSNGDVVFVNEDVNLMGNIENFFQISGGHQPLIGNGVVVAGDEYTDVVSSLEAIKERVTFLTFEEVRSSRIR